ncbi:apolipoprotein F [Dromaius novaehollandiae]|uniref:apolipoprotein F n=1 Tax=Dromaius novaehollandiae TaxID=8790 RepID=UPI00311E2576
MRWALPCLLLCLHAAAGSTVPPGPDAAAAARALLARLSASAPPRALPGAAGVSCQDLQPDALPGFSRLPALPRVLAQAALALALSRAACGPQAEALVLELYRELEGPTAEALLQGLVQLQGAPGRGRLPLLLGLAQLGASVPVQPCSGLTPLSDAQLWGPVAGTHASLAAAAGACRRLQAACAGVAAAGPSSFQAVGHPGAWVLPAPGARSWLQRCSRAPRGRRRRSSEDSCSPAGEWEVHSVLEWVPGVSTLYNLGTSLYYAYQGCEELASERAWEAAIDLGYDGLAVLGAGVGGPVAYGVHLGLQPGLKAGVRALICYFTSDEDPPPAPTAHSGPVRLV